MNKTVILALITLFAAGCSAEQGVLSKNPEKEKFLNPLPKDKFVFVEVTEINKNQEVRVKKARSIPSIMPQIPWDWLLVEQHQHFFQQKGGQRDFLRIELKGSYKGRHKAMPVIKEATTGLIAYTFSFAGKTEYKVTNVVPIETLPSPLKLSEDAEEFLANLHQIHPKTIKVTLGPTVRWDKSLELIKINADGTVEISYDNKNITLAPGEEWSEEYKIFEEKKDKYFSIKMLIKNYGLLEKDKVVFHRVRLR